MANTTLKALSDRGIFKVNMPLTKTANIAAYYRDVTNDGAEKPIALANEAIVAIVKTVAGNDQAAEDERVALMLKADGQGEPDEADASEPAEPDADADDNGEPEVEGEKKQEAPVEKADAIQKEANAFILRAVGDTEFNTVLHNAIEADKQQKVAPLYAMARLRLIYGDDLNGAPVPGTKTGDKECGNNPADKRRTMVKKKDGTYRESWVSVIDKMADALPDSVAAKAVIKAIDDASSPGVKNDWTVKNMIDRKQARQDASAVLTLNRGMLRKAIALHLHFRACESLPNVEVSYKEVYRKGVDLKTATAADKLPRSTRYPIVIKDKTDSDNVNTYAITQFLGLDPNEARDAKRVQECGGVWQALLMSGGRGPEDPALASHITTVAQFEEYAAEVKAWLDKREYVALLQKELAKGDDGSKAFIKTLGDLYLELKPIYDQFQKVHGEMQAAANKTAA